MHNLSRKFDRVILFEVLSIKRSTFAVAFSISGSTISTLLLKCVLVLATFFFLIASNNLKSFIFNFILRNKKNCMGQDQMNMEHIETLEFDSWSELLDNYRFSVFFFSESGGLL